MRAFARISLLVASLLATSSAAMADGVYLPPAPTGSGGEDVIETADGARCRQSMNSPGPYLDVGMEASGSNSGRNAYALTPLDGRGGQQALGYARITIPLGRRPSRIDCSRLYELEIARMKREIELLKLAAE